MHNKFDRAKPLAKQADLLRYRPQRRWFDYREEKVKGEPVS